LGQNLFVFFKKTHFLALRPKRRGYGYAPGAARRPGAARPALSTRLPRGIWSLLGLAPPVGTTEDPRADARRAALQTGGIPPCAAGAPRGEKQTGKKKGVAGVCSTGARPAGVAAARLARRRFALLGGDALPSRRARAGGFPSPLPPFIPPRRCLRQSRAAGEPGEETCVWGTPLPLPVIFLRVGQLFL